MGSNNAKIGIMAAVFVAVLGVAVYFLFFNKKAEEAPPGGTGMPGQAATGAVPMQVAALPQLSQPPAPVPAGLPAPVAASWSDPFKGGPPPPKRPLKPPPPPAEVKVFELPPIAVVTDRVRRGGGGGGWKPGPGNTGGTQPAGGERVREAPVGRHAGWIYSSNGQIWAIFEDSDGAARAVRVGDEIGGYRVKAIAQDHIILADADGREQKLKLQGLDTFQGKSRGVTIDANPGGNPVDTAPAWGGQ
jgi:hypothetical protein